MTKKKKTMTEPAKGGEAGYATLAKVLSAWFALDPPLDSRQVHQWHLRRTLNKDGEAFPGPVREVDEPKRGQPRWMFDVPAVVAWYSKGVPDLHGVGWRVPGGETVARSAEVAADLDRLAQLDGNETAP